MSHKATNWLSGLDAGLLSSSEFRVLFHLCDCHNPSEGCFPKQSYLLTMTGVSNGTLNNALAAIEARGLIRRVRTIDDTTKRRRPTHYILGFDLEKPQAPTPETGDGKEAEPSPETGDGAISRKTREPSPKKRGFHLQPTGEQEPVIEPVREPRVRAGAKNPPKSAPVPDAEKARFWAGKIRQGRHVPQSAIPAGLARLMLAMGLVGPEDLKASGISC